MKLIITAFCAAFLTAPLSFAGKECEKGGCDKKNDEATMVACDKCDKHSKKDKEEAKDEESTLVAGKDCDKGKCDGEKEEATFA